MIFQWGMVAFDALLREGILACNLTSGAKPAGIES